MKHDNEKYCQECDGVINIKAEVCTKCGVRQSVSSLKREEQKINAMHLLKKYIAANKLMSSVIVYFMVSIVLKLGFSINILIPCLWKTLFHFECPGCGLTTAFMKLLTFDISGAYNANPLIFIVLPLGMFYIYNDFIKFKIKLKC